MKKRYLALVALSTALVACNPDVCRETEESAATAGGIVSEAHMPNKVYFEFDNSTLDEQGKEIVKRQAEWLKSKGGSIVIEGNADERGTREYNRGLSARRAEHVKRELAAHGVDVSRVQVIANGKDKLPFPAGSTPGKPEEERHGLNRVAETIAAGGAVVSAPATVSTESKEDICAD